MTSRLTDDFQHDYRQLRPVTREEVKRDIERLASNLHHPGVPTKKIVNAPDVWEARVDRYVRITFQVVGDTLILRRVATRDLF